MLSLVAAQPAAKPTSWWGRLLAAITPRTGARVDLDPRRRAQGVSGPAIYVGRLQDDDPNSELRGPAWYGDATQPGIASKMMRNGDVRRAVGALVDPLATADFDFDPVSEQPVDLEIAAACTRAFFDCIGWHRMVKTAFTLSFRDGGCLVEFTDDVMTVPESLPLLRSRAGGFGIFPTAAHVRSFSTIEEWHARPDDPSALDHVVQQDPSTGAAIKVDANRFVRFTWDQEGHDFAGFAQLRGAYGGWKLLNLFNVIDGIRHERQGVGTPTLTMGAVEDGEMVQERERAETILSELRAHDKGYLILPNGWTFEWSTAGGFDTALGEAIERCKLDIAYAFGVAHLRLGHGGKPGSFALATTQEGLHHALVASGALWFNDVMNHGSDGWSPIARFVRLNYGERAIPPKLVARNLPTEDWAAVLPMLPSLISSGVVIPDERLEAFVRQILRLTKRDPRSERRVIDGSRASETEMRSQADMVLRSFIDRRIERARD